LKINALQANIIKSNQTIIHKLIHIVILHNA